MADDMPGVGNAGRFEQIVLPHLDAAYNLARWLVRNQQDAQDIVQESYLRAFKFFSGFQGGDPRAWLLKIVRNTSYSFLEKNRPAWPRNLTRRFMPPRPAGRTRKRRWCVALRAECCRKRWTRCQ